MVSFMDWYGLTVIQAHITHSDRLQKFKRTVASGWHSLDALHMYEDHVLDHNSTIYH